MDSYMQTLRDQNPPAAQSAERRVPKRAGAAFALTLGICGAMACGQPAQENAAATPAEPSTGSELDPKVRIQKNPTDARQDTLLPSGRPPFPNMASDAWGKKVIAYRETLPGRGYEKASYREAVDRAMERIHAIEPGSEAAAASLATVAWTKAASDDERSLALSLLAAALVLDPAIENYRARLTDAHGLVMYAGTLPAETVLGQAARAFVAVAVGRVYEGEKLTDVLSGGPPLDADAGLFIGLSRRFQADRSDVAFQRLRSVVQGKAESARARSALAEGLLEMGLADSLLEVVPPESLGDAAYLMALRGRALVLTGQAKDGVMMLRTAAEKVSAAERGKVLYWLGRSLAQQGRLQESQEILQSLTGRPGYASEHAMLAALVAQVAGDYPKARERAESVCSSRGVSLGLALSCNWAVVDACAGMGDEKCVSLWGKRAVGTDGDVTRLQHARAALGIVGKAAGVDVDQALKRAHQLSPFDPDLAKRVGDKAVRGGNKMALLISGARRALFFEAKSEVELALAKVVKTNRSCRVCRALFARASADVDESARRALGAFQGEGPQLDEEDLLPLIHALGGSPIDAGKKVLQDLTSDQRPRVQKAAYQAIADLANPAARKERMEAKDKAGAAGMKNHDHDHDHGARDGTAPVPRLPMPGAPGGGQP